MVDDVVAKLGWFVRSHGLSVRVSGGRLEALTVMGDGSRVWEPCGETMKAVRAFLGY